ncbi:MAG: DOMON-like domain-containing protein [Chakrabartia sp.]
MGTIWQHRSSLRPHPAGGISIARAIDVDVRVSGAILALTCTIMAAKGALRIPAPAEAVRTDGLWQTSCCELFLRAGGTDYFEFNLSPSSQWAAYHFADYREDMAEAHMNASPAIACTQGPEATVLSAQIDLVFLPPDFAAADWRLGLSCVIEGADGAKAYWALNHPPEKPDFHHEDCFALTVRAAERL